MGIAKMVFVSCDGHHDPVISKARADIHDNMTAGGSWECEKSWDEGFETKDEAAQTIRACGWTVSPKRVLCPVCAKTAWDLEHREALAAGRAAKLATGAKTA